MKVEEKLNQYVVDNNIAIKDIATLIGKTRNTVASILKGESAIDANSIITICDHYRLPISHFIEDPHKQGLVKEIKTLLERIDRLEYYLSRLLLEKINRDKSEVPIPENIYKFPQIEKLSQEFDLFMNSNDYQKQLDFKVSWILNLAYTNLLKKYPDYEMTEEEEKENRRIVTQKFLSNNKNKI